MTDEIATAAKLLADCHPEVIVFHCTDTSMTQGPQGEGKILDIVKNATGIEALATSRLVAESAEIAGSLSQTASQLEALVGRFRITRG